VLAPRLASTGRLLCGAGQPWRRPISTARQSKRTTRGTGKQARAGGTAKRAGAAGTKPGAKTAKRASKKANGKAAKPAGSRAASRTGGRGRTEPTPLFDGYTHLPGALDEFFTEDGDPQRGMTRVTQRLSDISTSEFGMLARLADSAFMQRGVTFRVYSDKRGGEKIFPFDPIPRVIPASDWRVVDRGLKQRTLALNMFLEDIYSEQRVLDEGVMPRAFIDRCKAFEPRAAGVRPPHGVYIHIAGIDLLRDKDGAFLVLEDNLRSPSGVSYVLENREVMKRLLPRVFASSRVQMVAPYPTRLHSALARLAPEKQRDHQPRVVVLTPGAYNSAYFEHSFLARTMGVDLVEGGDLFVAGKKVYVRTTTGPAQVDVIYRRIDDAFLDPNEFRADSMLGVPGLMSAYRAGNVTLANAVGTGVADDKAVYPFVHDLIRFYLAEEPVLGQVDTLVCAREADLKETLSRLPELVVKRVDGAGGYGMLVGPTSTRAQIRRFRAELEADPDGYIAQPLVEFSCCPTWCRDHTAPRRVDLRPYIVWGGADTDTAGGTPEPWVLPGGLTRVALKEGSYVVNSSQGGGSKDTWVLQPHGSGQTQSQLQQQPPGGAS